MSFEVVALLDEADRVLDAPPRQIVLDDLPQDLRDVVPASVVSRSIGRSPNPFTTTMRRGLSGPAAGPCFMGGTPMSRGVLQEPLMSNYDPDNHVAGQAR